MANRRIPERWRSPLRRTRDGVFRFLDRLVAWVCPAGPRRGAAILMPHGLGDLIVFTAAYRHLRAHYAEHPILLVCSGAGIAYAKAYLGPERTIELDRIRFRRDPWYRMTKVYALARAGIAIIIQPAQNREHMVDDALMRASGAVERIGAAGSPLFIADSERSIGDGWYTQLHVNTPGSIHETEYYAAFAEWVTGSRPRHRMLPLARPLRHPDAPDCDYLVIAAEASSLIKAWPFDHFVAAAAAIAASKGLTIVLAGQDDRNRISSSPAIVDLRGRTDIQGLAALFAHARLVLCNDSGPAHLAAALGAPVAAVGSGGMPGRYLPYPEDEPGVFAPILVLADPPLPCFGCGWRCRYLPPRGAPVPCIAEVPVEAVVGAALAILSELTVQP